MTAASAAGTNSKNTPAGSPPESPKYQIATAARIAPPAPSTARTPESMPPSNTHPCHIVLLQLLLLGTNQCQTQAAMPMARATKLRISTSPKSDAASSVVTRALYPRSKLRAVMTPALPATVPNPSRVPSRRCTPLGGWWRRTIGSQCSTHTPTEITSQANALPLHSSRPSAEAMTT